MDLRIHFDRPATPMELKIEDNSQCILSELGTKLKKVRIAENGRWINIRVNSKTYHRPVKNKKGMPALFGGVFDIKLYEKLATEERKNYLLTWLVDTFRTALDFFIPDGLDEETSNRLEAFQKECVFRARFVGKWAQHGDKRARVIIYQRFEQADIHIESKKYRARTSEISPILAQTSPNVFAFQIYLKKPEMDENGAWHLSEWSHNVASRN